MKKLEGHLQAGQMVGKLIAIILLLVLLAVAKLIYAFDNVDELFTSPLELSANKSAIMDAMYKGTKRNIQSKDESSKNVQTFG